MADLSGLILTVLGLSFEIASTLYSYSRDVKGASKDIQQLSNELFALIGVIEHIKMQREHTQSEQSNTRSSMAGDTDSLNRVLNETVEFLQELQDSLALPKSRFHAMAQKMKWPLQEKETKKHLLRLERVKSYFVLSQVTEEIDMTRQIASQISELSSFVQQSSIDKEVQNNKDKVARILHWLSPVNPNDIREKVTKSRIPDSGAWFISSKQLQNWTQSKESSTFWLNGITGSGKTFLMTTTIDEITLKVDRRNLSYFYCSFANAESLRAENILGSILAQACIDDVAIMEKLESLLSRNKQASNGAGKPRQLTEDETVDLIVQSLSTREEFYILLDGINECENPGSALHWIAKIVTSCPNCWVRLFISSMNEKDIDMAIEGLPSLTTEKLRQVDIRDDVRSLVLASLDSDPRLRRHSPELKAEIERALTKGAKGMFRWVQCQLDILSKMRTPGAVRKALENLPPTLDKTYEGLLDRIDGEEDRTLAREILEILCFTYRPFSLPEICEMLQVTPGQRHLDESKCLADPKDVLSICGSLLNYQQHTGLVALAHHSVKTYLTSDLQGRSRFFRLIEKDADRTIAIKCLTYLSFDAFSGGPCPRISSLREQYRRYPLLDYAAQRWTRHARHLNEPDNTLWTAIKDLFLSQDQGRGNFSAWVQMLLPAHSVEAIGRSPPLYYAASYGLTTVVRYLIEAGVDIEVHAGRCGATPLNIASFRGHYDVVKLLLEAGADPMAVDNSPGWSAIQWAQYNWHLEVHDLLVKSISGSVEPFDRPAAVADLRARLERPVESGVLVARVEIEPSWPSRLWWTLVGLAESQSQHPFGIAVHQAAKRHLGVGSGVSIEGVITNYESIYGKGVRAHIELDIPTVHTYSVLIGSQIYLSTQGIDAPDMLQIDSTFTPTESLKKPAYRKYAHIYVGIDGAFAGIISLDNPVVSGDSGAPVMTPFT